MDFLSTGTPPLTRFFGPDKNRVKGKPRYRRSILVLKPQNGEFGSPKTPFCDFLPVCTYKLIVWFFKEEKKICKPFLKTIIPLAFNT